ncbi:MAG: SGNH/GDSL hydrolase family protein [Oligoflexia bacterium]|nr:SGNH/GDSL hydrolase family protein [Oligoflexia bacterium]
MSRRTPLGIKIGFIAFGLVLGIVVSEVALELLRPPARGSEFENIADLRKAMLSTQTSSSETVLRDIIEPSADDGILFQLRPHIDTRFQRAHVTTNSCGMRDPERSIGRPPGTYRIALLGDSFAFGWGVEHTQSFGAQLEANLNRLASGSLHFEVLNFGVPGYSTFQEYNQFLERVADFDPDDVLLYFVDNDFGMPFFVRDVAGTGGLMASTEFATLAIKALNPSAEEQRLRLQGYDPNRFIIKLGNFCAERGVRFSVAVNPNQASEGVIKKLWSIKDQKFVRAITLYPQLKEVVRLRGINPPDLTLSFDPHPSPLKHRILADLLTPYFMDRL